MNREQVVEVVPPSEPSSIFPGRVELSDGSYILWDKKDGYFRVSYFARKNVKGSDLLMTLALAMKKPVHNKKIKDVYTYIVSQPEYSDASSS
jgi:uncharacterized protein YcgL (UPF0745 family)